MSLEKWLCWSSLAVAGVLFLLFLLDLFLSFPFGGSKLAGMQTVDIFGVIASAVLIYLCWNTLRDFR
jgi:hypothetical protein